MTKKKKRISTAAAKSKGRRAQKKVAARISKLVNIPAGKDELIESREMGQAGVDIKLIGEARRVFPYSIEVKNQEKFGVFAWLRQAKTNILPNTEWMLIASRNNFPPIVMIDRTTFDEIEALVFDDIDNIIDFECTKFEQTAEYNLRAWKVPDWVATARRKYKGETRTWKILCKKPDEFDIVIVDFEAFFTLLEFIPGDVKR